MAAPLIGTVGIGVKVDSSDVLKQLSALGTSAGQKFARNFNDEARPKPISVPMDVDSSDVPKQMDEAGKEGGGRFSTALSKTASIGFKAVSVAATAGFAAAGTVAATAFGKGFQRLSSIDMAKAKLDGLKFSAAEIESVMASALKAVDKTAYGLGEAATMASIFAATGIKAGDDMTRALKLTADVATIAGTSMADVGDILADVSAMGKVTGDTINRMGERGIDVLSMLSNEYGITREAAREMVSDGEISFDMFAQAMETNIGDAALESGKTFQGAMANIGAAIGRLGAAAIEPLFEAIKTISPMVIDSIDGMTAAFKPIFMEVGPQAADAIKGIGDQLAKIDWKAFAAQVGEVWDAIQYFFGQMQDASQVLQDKFSEAFDGMGEAVTSINWKAIGDTIAGAWGVVTGAIAAVITVVEGLWEAGLDEIFENLGQALEKIPWEKITEAIKLISEKLAEWGPILLPLIAAWASFNTVGNILGNVTDKIDGMKSAMSLVKGVQRGLLTDTEALGAAKMMEGSANAYSTKMLGLNSKATKLKTIWQKKETRLTWKQVTAQLAASAAALASPTTWIILGIVALIAAIVLLVANWDAVVKFITDIWGKFMDWIKDTVDAFMGWWGPIWEAIAGFFTDIWEGITEWFQEVWQGLVDWFTGFIEGFMAWWEPIWNVIWKVIKLIIDLVVNYFRFWAAVFVWLYEHAVKPVIDWIAEAFDWLWKNAIKPVIDFIVDAVEWFGEAMEWLYEKAIKPAIDWIADAFEWIWDNVIKRIIEFIVNYIKWWGDIFTALYEKIFVPIWEGIKTIFWNAFQWIERNVFKPFGDMIDLLVDGFEIAASAIETIWESIKGAVAKPINFVLDTIWNNGLRSFWNDLVTELKLPDMKLPKAPLVSFAQGGVLPGYTPGRDVHQFWSPTAGRLALSGGEGIIRPDALRRLGGKKWLDQVNGTRGRKARTGGTPEYGRGSADSKTQGVWGDAWDWLKNAAGVAWDFFTDPAGSIQKYVIDGIIKPKIGGLNIFGKTVAGLAGNTIKNFIPFFKDAAPTGAGGSAGMGYKKMKEIVLAAIPGARITSDYRPGAMTVNGGKSYHGSGRAIDIIPATMSIFNQVKRLFPNATELIFTPAGKGQLPSGNWSQAVKNQHWDHVHLAMKNGGVFDNGGWLQPGGMGMNMGRKPEAVFTADQFKQLEQNLVQIDSLLAAVRGYRAGGMFEGRPGQSGYGSGVYNTQNTTIEAGAVSVNGPDPYLVSLLTVNRLSEMAALR